MANIIQCKFCNMPFQSLGGKVCSNCLDQIDLDFAAIRDYLYDHPGVFDIDKVCEATEVKKNIILYLIAEKRLVFSTPEGSGVFTCSICHTPISEGDMCDNCKNSLSKTLGSVVTPPKSAPEKKSTAINRTGAKMHVRRDKD